MAQLLLMDYALLILFENSDLACFVFITYLKLLLKFFKAAPHIVTEVLKSECRPARSRCPNLLECPRGTRCSVRRPISSDIRPKPGLSIYPAHCFVDTRCFSKAIVTLRRPESELPDEVRLVSEAPVTQLGNSKS
jgi:hypothetical protein